jgi:acyl-CoA thioesterase-1
VKPATGPACPGGKSRARATRTLLAAALAVWAGCGWAAGSAPRILVFGDSLSFPYRLSPEQGWVGLLQARLRQSGLPHEVVNASVSRETTARGLARLDAVLDAERPAILVLTLGINDGFLGLPIADMKANLAAMVTAARARGALPVLSGFRLPPKYDAAYRREFERAFQEAAAELRVAFVPFLLEGIAGRPEYYLADGVHPNAAAQPVIMENVWTRLEPLFYRTVPER